ncbi:MAG TPA: septum formation initiator family protein [Thermoanaerobaculia bacterium]|nr:septum formation initiator family protein [Thermoanaerobaculia bacterium]
MSRPHATGRPDSLRPVLGAVVLLFMVLLVIAGLKSYRDLGAARERERVLAGRIEETRAGIERLRGRISRLRSDPVTLERLAREELGLVKPTDLVIELPRTAEPAPPSAAPPAKPVPAF